MQRQPAEIISVVSQAVEGVELHLVVVLAGVQGVEVGDAVHAEHHSLAIEHEVLLPDLARGQRLARAINREMF